MAREKKNPMRPRRKTVPVSSRAADRRVPKPSPRAKVINTVRNPNRLDIAGITVLLVVALMILLAIAVPLRNYYDGRAEIARLNESIAAKEVEKKQLTSEIDKFKSDSYIEQQARRRLGLVNPGETAFRILDPRMEKNESLTTDREAERDSRAWYEVLWDSVAEKPKGNAVKDVPHPEADEGVVVDDESVSDAVEDAINEEQGRPQQSPGPGAAPQ